jgi:hypothetical protein
MHPPNYSGITDGYFIIVILEKKANVLVFGFLVQILRG